MFFVVTYCSRKGPLATVWLASHLDRRIKRRQVFETSISESIKTILNPEAPFALRLSGQLLFGVARLYAKKCAYTLEDCRKTIAGLNKLYETATTVLVNADEGPSNIGENTITPGEAFDLMTQETRDYCQPDSDPVMEEVEYEMAYRSNESYITIRTDSFRTVDPMMTQEAPELPDDIILEKFREVPPQLPPRLPPRASPDGMEIDEASAAPDPDVPTPSNLKSPGDGAVTSDATAPPPIVDDGLQLPEFGSLDFDARPDLDGATPVDATMGEQNEGLPFFDGAPADQTMSDHNQGQPIPDTVAADPALGDQNGGQPAVDAAPVDVTMGEQNEGQPPLAAEDPLAAQAPAGDEDEDESTDGTQNSVYKGLSGTPQLKRPNPDGENSEDNSSDSRETATKREKKSAKRRKTDLIVDLVDGRSATVLTGHSMRALVDDWSSLLVDRGTRRKQIEKVKIDHTSIYPWVNPLLRPSVPLVHACQAQIWFARQVLRKSKEEDDQLDSEEELRTPARGASAFPGDHMARGDDPGFHPNFDFIPSGPVHDDAPQCPQELDTEVPIMDFPHHPATPSGDPLADQDRPNLDECGTPSNSSAIPILGDQGIEDDHDASVRDDFTPRTQVVLTHLQTAFEKQETPNPTLHMKKIMKGKSRLDASRWFFECLVLNARGCIELEQDEPYGDISITQGPFKDPQPMLIEEEEPIREVEPDPEVPKPPGCISEQDSASGS